MAGLPSFNEVMESLPEGLRTGAWRSVSRDPRRAWVRVADVGEHEAVLRERGWTNNGDVFSREADPSIPYSPPKVPRPSPDRIANAARRIRACDTEAEAVALLEMFARGEAI